MHPDTASPELRQLVPGMRRLLYVAAVLVLLAGFQLFVFSQRTATYFAWTIANPLGAAFLGAGYWASVSIEALAARQRIWANARIAVPTVFVFTVLTLVATLLHLSLFHLGSQFAINTRLVTYGWIAIYTLVPAIMVVVAFSQARAPGVDPAPTALLPGWLRLLLGFQSLLLLGFGVALFAAPMSAAQVWPWTLTPLLAQATGAWLIGLGVAAGHAVLERDARRLRPAAVAYVIFAVLQSIALARYPGLFDWAKPSGIIYVIVLATMLIVGAVGVLRGSPERRASGRGTRIPALAPVRDLALAKPRAVRVSLVAETHAWRWLTSTRSFSRDSALDVASR